jgi:drug/metabolite transporter (DMT)-like permease
MQPPVKHPLLGIACLVAAVGCFVVLDTSIKFLALSITLFIALWFRYMFQATVMTAVLLPLRGSRSLRTQHPWLHAVRGLLLLLTSGLGFFSLKYMPIGEFTAVVMLTPLMVTLLAALFLKERVNGLRWLLVTGGFSGAMLVVQPGQTDLGWAVLLPLAGVVVYALFQILTSRLARTEDPMVLHFYTGWVGTLVMTVWLPWIWQTIPDAQTWGLLLLAGSMGTVGHFLLILAFARAPAATLAPYLYAQIAFAMLADWLIFNHVPGLLELWGIGLIMVCGATAAWLAARPPQVETAAS